SAHPSSNDSSIITRDILSQPRIRTFIFFFQAEDGIRDRNVTGVQTCALPISPPRSPDLVSDPPNVGSMPHRWSLPLRYGSIRANNATENAVPLPPQKKRLQECFLVGSYRS